MGKIFIPTNFNIDLEFETAAFHTRLGAWIIDFIIQVSYISLAFKLFNSIAGNFTDSINDYDLWSVQLLILLPVFTYHFFSELFWNGQSVGKRILGLRVVNDHGGRATPAQYMIRWLLRSSDLTIPIIVIAILFGAYDMLKALLITSMMLIADLLLVVFQKQSKRLGDLAAGTLLIKSNPKGSLSDTIFMEVRQDYVPVYSQVLRLSDRDVNIIKTILDSWRSTGQIQVIENVSSRIKKALSIDTDMPDDAFLETLLKDYNYLATRE
ncbi:MAG: RDD family protein [Chitinophagaceae bacterium]|nr:RDD family protein [Chitinophagaceae bacterium]